MITTFINFLIKINNQKDFLDFRDVEFNKVALIA